MLEALGILAIFCIVLGLTYFVTKQIASFKQGSMYQKNLKIIEVLQLSPGQYLYLIEVGACYHLFTGTKEHLHYCMAVPKEQLILEDLQVVPFKDQLVQLLKGKEEEK